MNKMKKSDIVAMSGIALVFVNLFMVIATAWLAWETRIVSANAKKSEALFSKAVDLFMENSRIFSNSLAVMPELVMVTTVSNPPQRIESVNEGAFFMREFDGQSLYVYFRNPGKIDISGVPILLLPNGDTIKGSEEKAISHLSDPVSYLINFGERFNNFPENEKFKIFFRVNKVQEVQE